MSRWIAGRSGDFKRVVRAVRPISSAQPMLAIRCALVGHAGGQLELEAGSMVTGRCAVDNPGTAVAKVEALPRMTGVRNPCKRLMKSGSRLAWKATLGYRRGQLGDRLMVGQQPLELLIKVRILVPEPADALMDARP